MRFITKITLPQLSSFVLWSCCPVVPFFLFPLSSFPVVPLFCCPIVWLYRCPIVSLSDCLADWCLVIWMFACPVVPLSRCLVVPSSLCPLFRLSCFFIVLLSCCLYAPFDQRPCFIGDRFLSVTLKNPKNPDTSCVIDPQHLCH